MTRSRLIPLVAVFALSLSLAACDSDSNGGDNTLPLNTKTETNFAADPFVGFDPVSQQPIGSGRYAFYSLRDGAAVAATDSNSTKWDIALRGTTILVNGGTSGPGQGAAQVAEGLFEEITEAPTTGWQTDGAQGLAIPTGSGNGWYNYNPASMTVTPIPGRVLLIRTADGKYAKVRIVSYYKDSPATPTMESEARYYTFEYIVQPDGSRILE